jgi:hypothetical protein
MHKPFSPYVEAFRLLQPMTARHVELDRALPEALQPMTHIFEAAKRRKRIAINTAPSKAGLKSLRL